MKYMVCTSVVNVVGEIWQPGIGLCAMDYTLSNYDVENARDEEGKLTRDGIESWLDTHAGDFRRVTDFRASIEDGSETVNIPFKDEDNELTYNDCMYHYDV